jgi:hypothetical protein
MLARLSVSALLAGAVMFGSCSVARADVSVAGCRPATDGIAGMSAGQAIKTVTANIQKACGFTISGVFSGAGFSIDSWFIHGTSTYDAAGAAHLSWVGQVSVTDFYRVGSAEYVRLSVHDTQTAETAQEVRGLWPTYGITSKAVINAAGFTKWVKLPHRISKRNRQIFAQAS